MSLDPATLTAGNIGVIGAFIGIMLWMRKDIKDYFCKEMDEIKDVVSKDRDKLATVLQMMLDNDMDQISRISRLEGERHDKS